MLQEGAGTLADGTQALFDEACDLDQKLVDAFRDELEGRLNPQFQATDFVNGSESTYRVQFVYKTTGIAG